MVSTKGGKQSPQQFHFLSYFLSRFAFVGTHLVFVYWLNFLLNDPLSLGGNTLDYKQIKDESKCQPVIKENVLFDLGLFALWWGSHSGFARDAYKKAVGLYESPVERPLFAALATVIWGINVHYWKPITDCERWYPLEVPVTTWIFSGVTIAIASVLLVGFLWVLPDHVFGTSKYKYAQGQAPKGEIIWGFPYGIVRHPAATAFLWSYWALPAYTPNHVFLATLWSIFIVVGTLVFEEGGLKGEGEFGKKYAAYRKEVPAFYPRVDGLKELFGLSSKKDKKSNIPAALRADSPVKRAISPVTQRSGSAGKRSDELAAESKQRSFTK